MKLYIIAGEASGDLHGANLIKAYKKLDPASTVRAWGGERMEAEGAEVVKHYRDLAFMGFAKVILNLRTILGNLRACKADIEAFAPDAIVLIDYPGFNLRIAKFAHDKGIQVIYYISPQIWAWKRSRIKQIKRNVDTMLVILPFEQRFYAQYGMEVEFVGHPLLDELRADTASLPPDTPGLDGRPIIAVLPGSREQEIRRILPIMMRMVERFSDHQFVVAGAPSQPTEVYTHYMQGHDLPVIHGRTHELLRTATAALVTSGTATLESALIGTPLVVCYKGDRFSYWIARSLVKVKYISLVNLIMEKEVVTELIQGELQPRRLERELRAILPGGKARPKLMEELAVLKQQLGGAGASERAANALWISLNKGRNEAT